VTLKTGSLNHTFTVSMKGLTLHQVIKTTFQFNSATMKAPKMAYHLWV